MYSSEGKTLVSRVLAGKEPSVGNYISLGINIVYDASIDGSTAPYTHNKYHSPYIVDDIEIQNSTVLSNNQIKFTGIADLTRKYTANNVALVVKRSNTSTNEQRTIGYTTRRVEATTGIGWHAATGLSTFDTPVKFNDDNILVLQNNITASYNGSFSLYSSSLNDIIAFPVYFTNNASSAVIPPLTADAVVTLRILYGSGQSVTYSAPLVKDASGNRFSGDSLLNSVLDADVGTISKPTPFLFQKRIHDSTSGSPDALIAAGNTVTGMELVYSTATSSKMHFGSIRLTPDFDSDIGRTTTAFRKLESVLHKTQNETYTNAEYTLYGVV